MFAFFGQFGGNNKNWFVSLTHSFNEIEENLNLSYSDETGCQIAIGQSPNSPFFPFHTAHEDIKRHRFYALNGYMWNEGKFAENAYDAQNVVIRAGDQLLDQGGVKLLDDSGGIFILVSADTVLENIKITSDFSGLIPLYYTITPDGALLFSTHIRPLAQAISSRQDETGIIQQAVFQHTIGNRTLFKKISRLNPGETLTFTAKTRNISFSQSGGFYNRIDSYNSDDEAADALWADYLLGIKPLAQIKGTKGILLSGGFDTRLVVAGFCHYSNKLAAITFGDVDNFEVKIAQQVSQLANANQEIHVPIQDHNLTADNIRRLINQVEFVNFPYCETSAVTLTKLGAISASTGYGGESFLGGQAYTIFGSDLTQRDRFVMAIKRSVGLPVHFSNQYKDQDFELILQRITEYFNRAMRRSKNIFSPTWQELFDQASKNLKLDIANELSRILLNHPETIQQILERFWIEHHVLKHFGRQELTLMSKMPVILPTVHHAFLRRCSNLDPSRKIDHGIYLKLVKRNLGKFAQIPTSNIPIALTNPDLLLWLSRAWRANNDNHLMSKMMKQKGDIKGHRFGWSNFEVWLRASTFFEDCPQYISGDIFSMAYINRRISRIQAWEERTFSGQDFLSMISISQVINL